MSRLLRSIIFSHVEFSTWDATSPGCDKVVSRYSNFSKLAVMELAHVVCINSCPE